MDGETASYVASMLLLVIGLSVLLAGVFQGVVTELLVVGGLIGLVAIGWITALA